MELWTSFVGLVYAALLALSQLYGGNMGAAIFTLSLVVRAALLPLCVRAARRALRRHRIVTALQPEVKRLKKRFAKRPERLASEISALYARHGASLVDRSSLGVALLQLPLFFGLYSAIGRGLVRGGRFLWIADIARPDVLLAALAAVLSWVAATVSPMTHEQSRLFTLLPAVLTFIFLWRLAAGLGLFVAASNAMSILQSLIVRRMGPSPAPA